MTADIFGKLFGDKGYISQPLFDQLFKNGVQSVTKIRKNMKNISQIEHTKHRSVINFMVNIVAGLIAYTWQPKKPSLNLSKISDDKLPVIV